MQRDLLLQGDASPPSLLPTQVEDWQLGGPAHRREVPATAADLQPQQKYSARDSGHKGTPGPKPRTCTKGKGERIVPGACWLTQLGVSGGLPLAGVRTRDVARDLKLLPLATHPCGHHQCCWEWQGTQQERVTGWLWEQGEGHGGPGGDASQDLDWLQK